MDLDKATGPPAAQPPPRPPDVPEPRWGVQRHGAGWRDVCAHCGRRPGQHRNGANGRWWACWEIDALQRESDYWLMPWRQRWRNQRPPELVNTPGYQPGAGMFPTTLLTHVPLWRRILRRNR